MDTFNYRLALDLAEQLILHDETERALVVLNNLPAYYRDNEPKEVTQMRIDISSRIYTVQDYAENNSDDLKSPEQNLTFLNSTARGQLLRKHIEEANANNLNPNIVDYGPGDYGLPLALSDLGLRFSYFPVGLHSGVMAKAQLKLGSKWKNQDHVTDPTWFVAYEIIEHLHHVQEIRQVYDKVTSTISKIFLSTPKYCYDVGNPVKLKWRDHGLPHLRAYTPNEFYQVVVNMFPGFKFQFIDNEVMCLIGDRI